MVEDAPDDLVHEMFAQQFWAQHPLGRPILGTPETVVVVHVAGAARLLRPHLRRAESGHRGGRASRARAAARPGASARSPTLPDRRAGARDRSRRPSRRAWSSAQKDIEQSHLCLGTPAYPQAHDDRHALYVLNTILGGSMSSRLFQHIREERGLAYAVFSNLTTYSDAGHGHGLRRVRDRQGRRGRRSDAGRVARACATRPCRPTNCGARRTT